MSKTNKEILNFLHKMATPIRWIRKVLRMSRYRQVYCLIWNDDKFPFCTDDCQLVFFHLLTTPYGTPFGLYKASLGALADEKRWPRERYDEAFHEAVRNNFVEYDSERQVIYIPNFLEYNKPNNPNVLKTWFKTLDELPKCEFMVRFLIDLKTLCQGYGSGFQTIFEENFESLLQSLLKAFPKATLYTDTDTDKDSSKKPSDDGKDMKIQMPESLELAERLFMRIKENKSDFRKPNLARWAEEIDRMIRLDKRRPDKIAAVIDWCQADNMPSPSGFCWAHNILSAGKLRKQYDKLELRMLAETKAKKGVHVPIREAERRQSDDAKRL